MLTSCSDSIENDAKKLAELQCKAQKIMQKATTGDLEKYKLGTSATVLRSLQTIKKYQLVNTEFDAEGSQFYSVYDLFFQRWVAAKN